jgi:hypothetical protein
LEILEDRRAPGSLLTMLGLSLGQGYALNIGRLESFFDGGRPQLTRTAPRSAIPAARIL